MSSHIRTHSRFARSIVDRALQNATTVVARAETSGGGGGDSGAAAAAAAAKARTAAWSNAVSEDFDITLAVLFLLFLLCVAPLAANYYAVSRSSGGFFLRSVPSANSDLINVTKVDLSKASSPTSATSEEKADLKDSATVTIFDRPPLRRIIPSSAFFAHSRAVYNRFFLPTSFLFSLTWGQVVVAVVYEAVFVFCLFFQAGSLETNWKRPGAVCVAQVPILFILATKNNSVGTMIGKGFEKLNFLHRVAGRLTILGGALHTVLFFAQYEVDFTNPVHTSGVVAFVAFVLIFATSISYFRRAFYQLFLVCHIAGMITFVVALNYHVPEFAKPYTIVSLVLYGIDLLCRIAKTRIGTASIVALPGGMTLIQSHTLNSGWRPGQHVRLRALTGLVGWESHPFSVANAPVGASPLDGSHNLTLLAKSNGDFTRFLNRYATRGDSGWTQGRTIKVGIQGPYGGTGFTDFSDSQAVVLFAGGSGITFAASTFEELVGDAVKGRLRARSVTLVWSFKELACIEWYQSFLTNLVEVAREKTNLKLTILLRVTRAPEDMILHSPIPYVSLRAGRPHIPTILNSAIDDVLSSLQRENVIRGGGVAVGTCGPRALVDEVRKAVSGVERTTALAVGGITSHSETFGL